MIQTVGVLLLAIAAVATSSDVLVPPSINLAYGRNIHASATCGELNGQQIREMFCTIAAGGYSPHNHNSYSNPEYEHNTFRQAKSEKQSIIQGGQNCDFCEGNTSSAHPASNMVDGTNLWWQSPPLSRGNQYNEINITIDLGQEFHIAYVWIQMANSPRPGTWILERSTDYGVTYTPWQYFASSPAECARRFGTASLRPITEDDAVICTHEFSKILPFEHGEVFYNLLENRPGNTDFGNSLTLQSFARATNVRFRFLKTKTFQGSLMDFDDNNDPTITRRYYYAIKEVLMGGRCVCNGHARSCDFLDPNRPKTMLCRCEHNTCGDNCDRCCLGFEQKPWARSRDGFQFKCEPCNCHGHSESCAYEEDLDKGKLSLDINGEYSGGGRCQSCRDNTKGINCNECADGFYRPPNKVWNETDVCQPCSCDPAKHSGKCAEETGKCECLPQFTGENCDQCAAGYFDPPVCKPCQCNVVGTVGDQCLAVDGKCPCKENYGGDYCDECSGGFTNLTAGCVACNCDTTGASSAECDKETGQCPCHSKFGDKLCDTCNKGFYNYPECAFCGCDPSGTEGDVCDIKTGQCLCKPGFAGTRCDQCDENYYGYPNCKACLCDSVGSKSVTCDLKTGECPCGPNFTGRMCDKCAAGFYKYPQCLACKCFSTGSKGLTCDNDGQCYCRQNFVGKQCDKCKPNFFNFPVCEECNCNPNGVTASFAGCDKVAPGELCTCKDNVQGRTCNQCKSTFWDLKHYHPEGCIDCACNMTGVVSLQNSCDQQTGQCDCKRYVGGSKCDQCADGFFNMEIHNHVGCEPCDCDVGGALGQVCNMNSGQCRCRPRVDGLKCNDPIKDHYFPTLWHMQYEAEEARLPNNEQVRYAVDPKEFPNFSWKGYTVFSPIQDEIYIDVDVRRSSVYNLLLHYRNPTPVPIELELSVKSLETISSEYLQNVTVVLPVGEGPVTTLVNNTMKPFVMSPGHWRITLRAQKRLFLDYIVLMPAEYYEAPLLKDTVYRPCLAHQKEDEVCIDLLYPPLPNAYRTDASKPQFFQELDLDGKEQQLPDVPVEDLPETTGQAILVQTGEKAKPIRIKLNVTEDGIYYAVFEYFNLQEESVPLKVTIEQGDNTAAVGTVVVNHCPYATFCRELLTSEGKSALVGLQASPPEAVASFTVQKGHRFGIAAVNLVKEENWNKDYLRQVEVCIRVNGVCKGLHYLPPPNAIITETESGHNVNNSISGDKLPFNIDNAANVELMSLDSVQSTLEISGVVPSPNHYVFLVHYYNHDNTPLNVDVMVQNDRFADARFHYCPTVTGCRTIILDKEQSDPQFYLEDKYSLTFYFNNNQKGPIYIDSVTAIPHHYYRENLLKPTPVYTSNRFFDECSDNYLQNDPQNVSDFCRGKIFSLTTEFNNAALPCDCNHQGSLDFCCDEYGGQCKCRDNIIGRKCDKCAPRHYGFPNCMKCKCGEHQQCDEQTGKCFCPRYVEGLSCDKCVPYGFGYDPLIGCQLCGCRPEGSDNGELRCDANNGQCFCKANVGGRQCDRCLPGFYGYPNCYPCQCNHDGTTEAICDENTAQCICKKNVGGAACDTCVAGTFYLRGSDPDGCSNCFCFGVTDRCTSSNLPVNMIIFDDQSWESDNPNGNVTGFRGVVTYTPGSDNGPDDVYLLQKTNNQDYTTSYGLVMSFLVASFKGGDASRISARSDVQLISDNTVLEYWATEQPQDPSKRFEVRVPLLPEYWLLSSGEPATRSQLMHTLKKLEAIAIKASYYEKPSKAIVEQFEIEVAGGNRFDSPVVATSVEQCQCPAPYTGFSCQKCSAGFYRVQSDSVFGSSCVPCNCHGHSGTCDAATGICTQCQHNTEGEHCERCVEGFYGNSTTGSPYACLACACPHPTTTNNFAVSCEVSETGILQTCECKPGFSGDRCERCDIGFYGNPNAYGGTCEPCFCNKNNDLSVDGTCHPQNGYCADCENNTDGRHCELCKQWFYGDAVGEKNCTECTCNHCGSTECNSFSGQCNCQPLVEGDNCDSCVADAWGFDSCQGCRMCECGTASSNSQCDMKTGQCACMPGSDGLRCEHCKHGFWDYGSQGCKKCDCESDLSMGTVCDIRTGQCHCQEGASGPRCDTCIDGFLRIPTLGCRQCDECVFALNSEIDGILLTTDALGTTLANVSSVALTGAHLHKINKKVEKYRPRVEMIINANKDDSEINGIKGEIEKVLGNATAVDRQVASLEEQLQQLESNIRNSTNSVERLRKDAGDLVGVSNWVISGIKALTESFETRAPLTNKEYLLSEAEKMLEKMRNNTLEDQLEQVRAKNDSIQSTINDVEAWKNKIVDQNEQMDQLRANLQSLSNVSNDFEQEINKIKRTSAEARALVDKLPFFQITALVNGIEKDSAAIQEMLESNDNNKVELLDLHNQLIDLVATIKNTVPELNQSIDTVRSYLGENGRRRRHSKQRRSVSKTRELLKKLRAIEEKGKRLIGIYDVARLESENGVAATHIYDNLIKALSAAREMTTAALAIATETSNDADGISKESAAVLEKSSMLTGNISQIKNEELPEMETKRAELQARFETLNNTFTSILESVALAQGTLDEHKAFGQAEDEALDKLTEVEKITEEIKPKIEDLENQTQALTENREEYARALLNSDTQLSEASRVIPEVSERIHTLNERMNNNTNKINEYKDKISLLKEKIALARDKTNMIKLSAHFEPRSYLELPLPQQDNDVSLFTDVRFFLRTTRDAGTAFYLGNEARHNNTEFLAVEIENKNPKLTIDLGKGPTSSVLPVNVADNQWREIIIRRAGGHVVFEVSKLLSDEVDQSSQMDSKEGNSVLDLDPDSHRIFLGGFPDNFRVPQAINNTFTGDIDTLRINGMLIGLWNSKKTEQVHGAPHRPPFAYEAGEESAVSFNGNGYLQIGVGNSNLRKKTTILLSFMTYQPDGLLFFVGKDHDQLVVEITNGRVKLSFDLGSGVGRLTSARDTYHDGKWHTLHINRIERQAKLDVDGKDVVDGESPGTMFEMSVTDSIYLGGLPHSVEARFTVQPFRGCLKNLKIDSDYANLNHAKAAKGIQPSCPFSLVRVASLISERTRMSVDKLSARDKFDLSLRFRTEQTPAHIVSVSTQDKENLLKAVYDNGKIIVTVNGDDEQLQVPLTDGNDGNWHYFNAVRRDNTLVVTVNDRIRRQSDVSNINDHLPSEHLTVELGRNDDGQNFVGCISDVSWNGQVTNFATYKSNEVKLTTCIMGEPTGNKSITEDEQENQPEAPTPSTPKHVELVSTIAVPTKVVSSDSCALPVTPYGEREDSTGYRFGVEKGSHLEFDRSLSALENNLVFSVQVHAAATSGFIFFVSNEKQTEFITLYLNDGHVNFMFGQPTNYVHLTSNSSILNNEWHTIRFVREGNAGALLIDGSAVANNFSLGLENIQVQPPIYIGGVTQETMPIRSKIFRSRKELPIRNEFGGCLRDFKMNDKKFNNADREVGVKQCSDIEETGIYFGKDGGYAILDPDFEFTSSFLLEMEIRPRTKNALLLSVGVLEYVTVQIVDGNVVLTVDLGGGSYNATASHNFDKVICDGHWHHVKILMKRNIITVSVDQRSGMTFIKQNKDTVGKDRLYLGGMPKDKTHGGIVDYHPYIGCVRNVVFGNEKAEYKLNGLQTFGDVIKNSCPLN